MRRRPGFTLLESVLALGFLAMTMGGAAMLTMTAGRLFDRTSAQIDADWSATYAVQRMSVDLQEAKQVTVLSPTSMRVFFPQVDGSGTYIRSALDTVNTIDYFRGTSAGAANPSGDCLLRRFAGSAARVVCSGVSLLQFSSSNPSSVSIRLQTERPTVFQAVQREIVYRAIFLRNY